MRFFCLAALFLFPWELSAQSFPTESLRSYRVTQELTVPVWDPGLANACAARASVLAETGVLSHIDDQDRGPGLQMVSLGGLPGEYGEILGAGGSPQEVWEAWLASKPHRDILLTPGWVTWGSGIAIKDSTVVYVVRFWRP